jgi:serine/threonine-protein kinase
MSVDRVESEVQRRTGQVLEGRYRIERLLAEGGSACVYFGRDLQADRAVAIKVMHAFLVQHPEVVRRFVGEARATERVKHRGVMQSFCVGKTEDGAPFLVTELLSGENLEERRLRKGGRLPVDEVLFVADGVLSALGAAHDKGILHRDVKPENIFLTDSRELKLLDFGIARMDPGDDLDSQHEATRTGVLLGTVDFMPPEQARGDWETVTVASDLWAVGATMFTLLGGRTVHDEPNLRSQLRAVAHARAVSLGVIAPELPRAIVELVDAALDFDAAQRWKTARAMRYAIRIVNHQLLHGDRDLDENDSVGGSAGPGPRPPARSLRPPVKPR